MSVNKVILIGNVGQEPEVKHLENGGILAKFSLATSESYKNKNGEKVEITDWHNINCWGNSASFVAKYVTKGTLLYVEGRLRTTSFKDKEGNNRYTTFVEVNKFGERVEIMSKKDVGSNIQNNVPDNNENPDENPDDLPF